MGFLRLFLALIVFLSHSADINITNISIYGAISVRLFYLISGFYIQLIIVQYDSQKHWKRKFYLSRLLRIFPCYYLILVLTIWFNGTSCGIHCTNMVINGSISSLLFYYISNLFIIGQELGRFLVYHFSTGTFSFYSSHPVQNYWASSISIICQSWSIAMELLFYLFAPFILKRRSRDLIIVAAISFAIKIFLVTTGHDNLTNWYNDFFPAEIHTFLLGALAARIACDIAKLQRLRKYLAGFGAVLLWTYFVDRQLELFSDPGELLIISAFCFLPFTFLATKNSRIDRWVGELSYPVYLNHIIIMNFLGQYIINPLSHIYSSIALSVVMSILIVLLIEHPITKFRHRMFRNPDFDNVESSQQILSRKI